MGNEVERQQYMQQHSKEKKKYQIFSSDIHQPSPHRPSIEGHFRNGTDQSQVRMGRFQRGSEGSERTDQNTSKHKKYLSLTKEVGGENQLKVSKSSSKEKKGIKLTPPQNHLKYSISHVINYNDPLLQTRQSNIVKKSIIRPRDLPRHSSQKIIPQTPFKIRQDFITGQIEHNMIHKEPQVEIKNRVTIPYANQPQISINYAFPVNSRPQAESSYISSNQSNHITPLRHIQTNQNWMKHAVLGGDVESKKLKKVPLTRSFDVQSNPTATSKSISPENQEQSMFVKQVSDMTKLRHQLKPDQKSKVLKQESKLLNSSNKENQEIVHDQYQTLLKSTCREFKETESKYAVAYQQNGVYIQHMLKNKPLSESITKDSARSIANKYSVAVDRWMAYKGTCDELEEKVEREVISHAVIEEPFRFPTATDISEDQRSDNTSFLPIQKHHYHHNDSDSYIQLQGQDLLQYCKPNINSKVLADMLKLPLKS